ncbi:MAG: hypothetical protein ABI690_09815 [Chloroflexota bacterium]
MFRLFLKAGLWGYGVFVILSLLSRLVGGSVFHGGVLAFASPVDVTAADLNWNIVIYDIATHMLIRPFQYERRTPRTLDWSPDGMSVAGVIGGNSANQNNIVKVTGHGADLLLPDKPASVGWLSWSPDGKQFSFMMGVPGHKWGIYLMDTSGENIHRPTKNREGDLYPAWSPDGSEIAFSSELDNQLYIMNADGSGEHQLAVTGNHDQSPSWSPDGSKIAFITHIDTSEKHGSYIALMNADGSQISLLAPDGPPIQGFPSWSPDGHYLAFVASENNRDAIYVVDMQQGGLPRKLADNVYYIYHERWDMWSPDEREIAFSQAPPPVSGVSAFYPVDGLYLVDVASGSIRKIADIAAAFPIWQP